jgi:hypothetical protein
VRAAARLYGRFSGCVWRENSSSVHHVTILTYLFTPWTNPPNGDLPAVHHNVLCRDRTWPSPVL